MFWKIKLNSQRQCRVEANPSRCIVKAKQYQVTGITPSLTQDGSISYLKDLKDKYEKGTYLDSFINVWDYKNDFHWSNIISKFLNISLLVSVSRL